MCFTRIATVLFAAALTSGWATASLAASRRPNVIIVMPDQMRGHDVGVAGNDQVKTPHLDRLARAGVFLPNAFANNPLCCPARATILTGTYPQTHGVIVNDLRLRESVTSLAEIFADAGYATGFIGKWHLDGGIRMPGFIPPGPRRQGFAFWAANECNHEHFDSIYFHNTPDPIPIKKFEPEVWMDEALRFIRERRDQPFFLWWTCGPPHNPYKAPPEYEKLYDAAQLEMRPNFKTGQRLGTREDIARYYAMITAVDDQIGRLLDALDEMALADDTIVLVTSDHGDMLGSHGLPLKTKPWEESIRVPGIVRFPRRIPPGERSDLLFSHVDIAPTLLALCGLDVPPHMQGRNLSKQLAGESKDLPEEVFFQIFEPRRDHGLPGGWRGVRTTRYMYARLERRPWVLYDLEQDPYEMNNLVDDPRLADLRADFEARITRQMDRTNDRWSLNLRDSRIFYKGPAIYDPHESGTKENP